MRRLKNKVVIMVLVLAIISMSTYSYAAVNTNPEGSLEVYLSALQNGDYVTAYNYLDSKSRENTSLDAYIQYQELESSLRSIQGFSCRLYNKAENTVIFAVSVDYTEKVAYSLAYSPLGPLQPVTVTLEDGEWRIAFSLDNDAVKRELDKYAINQKQDESKSTDDFIRVLDEQIPALMSEYGIPGCAVALVENNEIVFLRPFGYADILGKKLVTEETMFNIGSTSKPVAAWGALALVRDGVLELDVPAEQYMKRWKFPDSEFNNMISVSDLLNHKAGLDVNEPRGYGGYGPKDAVPTLVQSLRGELYPQYAVTRQYESGEFYRYNNANYTVLQLVVEDVTGLTFEDFMQENVLIPMNMNTATFMLENAADKSLATGYDNYSRSYPVFNMAEQAASGLYCTVGDLANFAINLNLTVFPDGQSSAFLPVELVNPVFSVQTMDYTLGCMTYYSEMAPILMQHQGASRGYMSSLATLPENGDSIIFLTNSDNGKAVMKLLSDRWLRWKVGSSRYIFDTLAYTPQSSRTRMETVYVSFTVAMLGISCIILLIFVFGIARGQRKLTTKQHLTYNMSTPVVLLVSLATIPMWWILMYRKYFHSISPFSDASVMNLLVSFLITVIGLDIAASILFQKR